ncbi:hypothetical protein ABW08_24065, partial [Pluralibacter gergoviae]
VRSIWLRHNLENFKKRLKALEEKVARDGIELTDSQIAALERKGDFFIEISPVQITRKEPVHKFV